MRNFRSWKFMLFMVGLLCMAYPALAQTVKVTGTVIGEEDGEPIIGASIRVKGTEIGTVTDLNGIFHLNQVPQSAKHLIISSVGMETQEVAVRPNVRIIMKSNLEQLDEVMVVAYGTAKKSSFTGSAATVKAEKIAVRQTANVTNALSGQVAGVQTTSSTGQPGQAAKVRIRGVGSFSANNEPLYVVDGVPYDGEISAINTADIESMTVLKDAASNALYGARGANGVIIITTKKGVQGQQPRIHVDAKWGVNSRGVKNYDVITDPATYYEQAYKAIYNGQFYTNGHNAASAHAFANANIFSNENGGVGYQVYTVPAGKNFIGTNGKINPNATLGYSDGEYYYKPDDWYKELFNDGNLRQEYNISISGAADKLTYYASFGYLDDSGIIPSSSYERYTSRLKTDYQVKKWFKLSANLGYTNFTSEYPQDQDGSASSGNLFYISNEIAPIYPLYTRNADGSIKIDSHGYTVYDFGDGSTGNFKRSFMTMSNPASQVALDDRSYVHDIFNGKVAATFDLYEGLQFRYSFGLDVDNYRSSQLYNAYYGQHSSMGGIIYKGSYRNVSRNAQYLLTYNKTFDKKHNIDVMAGYEEYDYKMEVLEADKENLYNPTISEINNAINNAHAYSSNNAYATQGLLSRVQYDYDDTYFLSASFRRDASSCFSPDNRWGNFWSIGGAWAINKEEFMRDADWIDFLKAKASYGTQGNDKLNYEGGLYINYYPYQDQYTVSNNGGTFATTLSYKGNKDITWETSHSFNAGFDFSMFNSRFGGSIEYFSRKTVDMLYFKPEPTSVGYKYTPMNVGSVRNNGLELDLNGKIYRSKKIEWAVNANATFVHNKILKLESSLNGEMISGSRIYREGESMYQLYLTKYAGVTQEDIKDAEGVTIATAGDALWYKDVKDKDGNVTGRTTTSVYTEATKYGTGNIMPTVYGGFGTTVDCYGFDFGMSFAYQFGGKIWDYTYQDLMHAGTSSTAGTGWHKDILNAWSETNRDSNIPKLSTSSNSTYANATSDRWLVKSDYLSLQNITLGYTVPKSLLRQISIESVRLYVVADNVALWSARKGMDPRQSYLTTNNANYSAIRSVSGGISVTF